MSGNNLARTVEQTEIDRMSRNNISIRECIQYKHCQNRYVVEMKNQVPYFLSYFLTEKEKKKEKKRKEKKRKEKKRKENLQVTYRASNISCAHSVTFGATARRDIYVNVDIHPSKYCIYSLISHQNAYLTQEKQKQREEGIRK